MHTYRKAESGGWEAGYQHALSFVRLGPAFGIECEAAAFASFLNGGRYNPYEIEALFRTEVVPLEDDDSIHHRHRTELDDYPRPQGMDYPQEATQRHK